MKKVLVIIILLAFAGGGLFAQTVDWSAHIEGAVAMLNTDDADEAVFGLIAPGFGFSGAWAQVQMSYTNAQGNFGFRARLRATGGAEDFNNSLHFHQVWGWFRMFDDLVEFRGGKIHDDQFNTPDPIGFNYYLLNSYGFVSYIRPTDRLTIGLGGFSPNLLIQEASFEDGALGLWGGFRFNLPGTTDIRVSLSFTDLQTDVLGYFAVSAVENLPISAMLRMNNLNEFGDTGELYVYGFVGYTGITNLVLNAGALFATSSVSDTDLAMGFGAWAAYAIGNIVPRVDVWYVSGGSYLYNVFGWIPGSEIHTRSINFNSDYNYISIRPSIQLNLNRFTCFELGSLFNIDMGDANAAGSSEQGVSYGLYVGVRVGF